MVILLAIDCAALPSTGHKEHHRVASYVPCLRQVGLGGWTSALTSRSRFVTVRTGVVGDFSNAGCSGRERAWVFEGTLVEERRAWVL